jgi:hypothetical protein
MLRNIGEDGGGTSLSSLFTESGQVDQFNEIMGYFNLDSTGSYI